MSDRMIMTPAAASFDPDTPAVVITDLTVTDSEVVTEARRWSTGSRGQAVTGDEMSGADLAPFVRQALVVGAMAIGSAGAAQDTFELEKLIDEEVIYQDAISKLQKNNPRALEKLKEAAAKEWQKKVQFIKEDKKLPVDRALGQASSEPRTDGHKMTAKGAAYRSNGGWFGLSYVCEASPDHMKVLSFEYQTGDAIPKAKWEDYGLWD